MLLRDWWAFTHCCQNAVSCKRVLIAIRTHDSVGVVVDIECVFGGLCSTCCGPCGTRTPAFKTVGSCTVYSPLHVDFVRSLPRGGVPPGVPDHSQCTLVDTVEGPPRVERQMRVSIQVLALCLNRGQLVKALDSGNLPAFVLGLLFPINVDYFNIPVDKKSEPPGTKGAFEDVRFSVIRFNVREFFTEFVKLVVLIVTKVSTLV